MNRPARGKRVLLWEGVVGDGDRAALRVQLLGPVRAWQGDTELALGGPRRRAVLGMLAMHPHRVVSRGELIDGVWGDDPPASAANSVHVCIAGLRRVLEPRRAHRAPGQVLAASGPGYRLLLESGQVDTRILCRHLADARRLTADGDLTAAARALEVALELWRGEPLDGIPGPWAGVERRRLEELRHAAVGERVDVMLALGHHLQALGELSGLIREYPLRERLHGQLMLAMYRCGRQADALAAFVNARHVLAGRLGPDLWRLHEQILNSETARDLPGPSRAVVVHRDGVLVHTQARDVARQAGDRVAEARALRKLGVAHERLGRYQAAVAFLREALDLSRETGDRLGEAQVRIDIGLVECRQGRYCLAAGHFRRARVLSLEVGDIASEARALSNLSVISGMRNDPGATEDLRRALAMFRELGYRTGEAGTLTGLGSVACHQGRYAEAAGFHEQALALFREAGERTGETRALNGLGEALLGAGAPDRAYAQHSAALTLACQIGEKYEQTRAHNGLGAALLAAGEPDRARTHYTAALNLAGEIGASLEATRARTGHATSYT